MGMKMPEKCGVVSKRQVINLRSCRILLVDSVEKMLLISYPATRRHTPEHGILSNYGQDIGSVVSK
jgi:hypothetical protein